MANRRIAMRKIRQVLRLAAETDLSRRGIARSLGLSRDTVNDYVTRAAAAGLAWPLPEDMDDARLDALLFPPLIARTARKPEPDWQQVHLDLARAGATMQVLHEEYLADHSGGMSYSHFCQRYRDWAKALRSYMRQPHKAGERVFVDYAGPTLPIHDPASGEIRRAQIFVGVLGASVYTYAEAHWSQRLPDWIAAHTRMFEFFGGVPEVVVCDNLKAAVTKASRTEPVVHPVYQHLAEHYGTMILPTRPRKPKDKAKVENAVLLVERWILFRLRKRVFTSLADLNAAIRELLADLNDRPFQKLPGCRRSAFEAIDRPVLKALPVQPFEYTEFRRVRVGLDGYFEVEGRPYSAPPSLCRQEVDLRITAATVEILHRGRRVGSHARTAGVEPVVDPQHLAPAQRHFGRWEPEGALTWAGTVGPHAQAFLQTLLTAARVKEEGYRAAQGLQRLAKDFGADRLEAACRRAGEIGATSLSSVRSILRNGLDQVKQPENPHQEAAFDHPNVRGANYYH
jgi:transposase